MSLLYFLDSVMPLGRRIVLCAAFACAAAAAFAQDGRPVRIVVPAPPGGNLDGTARVLAQRLTALTGETHIVDNRPGANTAIGTEFVVRAAADGRTLLYTGSTVAFMSFMQKLPFTLPQDLMPIIQVAEGHYVLVASADSGITSVQELVNRIGQGPQGLSCAAPPGPMAVACEQLKSRLRGRLTTVPYPGIAPAVTALLGGHVDFLFVNAESVEGLLQAGRLRALAATSPLVAGGVPLLSKVWPGFLMEGFSGLFAPAGTPPEKVAQVNRQVNLVMAEPYFSTYMNDTGQQAAGGSAEQFARRVSQAHRRYGELIEKLNLAPR